MMQPNKTNVVLIHDGIPLYQHTYSHNRDYI